MRSCIATVSLSGRLVDKLHAAADAGFDGVELFEPDLVSCARSPEEIRALADRLGLTLELYQPLRDVEGVPDSRFPAVRERARRKFALMRRLGMDLALCCSNVAADTVADDAVSVRQLRALGETAAGYGVRIAYEALAWGAHVHDYLHAWDIVRGADHPAVGVCLDSFHILSRGDDPDGIADIPGERLFFVQLADARAPAMDVLSWSRHHRLFPGEGDFDLTAFTSAVVRAGYRGPLSLEVFNDTFRQTDPHATAVHARRALRWLEDGVARRTADAAGGPRLERLTDAPAPAAVDFVEITAEDTSAAEALLAQAGFTARGLHRSKPVTLWSSGAARVVLNEQHAVGVRPRITGMGFGVADPRRTTARAAQLGVPFRYRRSHDGEEPLDACAAPGGTGVFWAAWSEGVDPAWVGEFSHGGRLAPARRPGTVTGVDHVSLTLPWQVVDESALFFAAVFGIRALGTTDVSSPQGFVHSRALATADRGVRLPLNVAPAALSSGGDDTLAQHVAFACDDARALARACREHGMRTLPVRDNYYADLQARLALSDAFTDELRALHLLYDRDAGGEYLQFYTRTVGRVFFEFVQRSPGYDGFGAGNAPVRLSAQQAPRTRL